MIDVKIKTIYRDILENRCSAEAVMCDGFVVVHTFNTLGKTKIMVHQVLLEGDLDETGLYCEIVSFGGAHFRDAITINQTIDFGIGIPHLMLEGLDIWTEQK